MLRAKTRQYRLQSIKTDQDQTRLIQIIVIVAVKTMLRFKYVFSVQVKYDDKIRSRCV